VETQLREKPLQGNKIQEFNYSEDKVVTLTYPDAAIIPCTLTYAYIRTLPNQVTYLKGSSMDSFSLEFLPKLDFARTRTTHRAALRELANLHNLYLNTLIKL